MTTISEYIQNEVFLPRLKKNGILVVYDPGNLYRELCTNLENDVVRIIDASESSITSRESALITLNELGKPGTTLEGMLVYVPAKAPITDEEKQVDPFSLYITCGSVFPEGDGDEYLNLCLKARPDYHMEIRKIFNENPSPSFAVIDAVGGGLGWPNLQTLLKVESARDILFAFLTPSDAQKAALSTHDAWVSEAKDLFSSCLGLKLITKGNTWSSISDELWRFLLFSEFVFDLPEPLPESLGNVPCAMPDARLLVEDLCDRLRNDRRTQSIYIDRAERIEKDLDLPTHCKSLKDLGVRDTFPFEERWFLIQSMKALKDDDIDRVKGILNRHANSVWVGKGESQTQWGLIRAGMNLSEVCDDLDRQFSEKTRSFDNLIEFYLSNLREADRLQREFEQSIVDYVDSYSLMREVIEQIRRKYRNLAAKYHSAFIRYFTKQNWPPESKLANADVFDKFVAPKLENSGRKVAYFHIDALRYELGVALERQLADDGQVQLHAAFSQLPSITTVGMASLLPSAGKQLSFIVQDNNLVPVLSDTQLNNVTQRMGFLRQKYGQRFSENTLTDFIRGKNIVSPTIDLLVIRSAEIDNQMEADPETALSLIYDTLKKIRVAIAKLKALGFNDIIIATDHGFFLNTQSEAGDVASKPPGNWITIHERLLIGSGSADLSNFVVPAKNLGIRGDVAQVAGPMGLVPYRLGERYFHGGVSLQECIVPVITIRLSADQPDYRKPKITVSYKNGTKRMITTPLPVIDIQLESYDLFSQGTEFEILLEAHDKKGAIVGEAKPGGIVNPATGTIAIKPGQRVQVTLKMQLEYHGKFIVKVMNPTTFAIYDKTELETDYTV
jgi:hypothetical protein